MRISIISRFAQTACMCWKTRGNYVNILNHELFACKRSRFSGSLTSVSIISCFPMVFRHNFVTNYHTSTGRTMCEKDSTFDNNFQVTDADIDKVLLDEESIEFIHRIHRVPGMGHNVLVIQPRVKWGPKRKWNTTPELQLAEAVTLAETLPGWNVEEEMVVAVKNPNKKKLFGPGVSENLRTIIRRNPTISAVFISQDILNSLQTAELEDTFGIPVYDRYSVVLEIFRDHARTKEAKLQVALAEIPYLRLKIAELYESGKDRGGDRSQSIGGSGETFIEKKTRLLYSREMKIRKALDILKARRHMLRKNRRRMEFPVIAVVGYTNSGKTSLIKALTQDASLEPKDQLFATLDVTVHAGLLPSNQKVLYVDTVGFISDIPTTLIQSFASTLEDVALADLIVHIRDISHPDAEAQKDNVIQTLESLNLPEKLQLSMVEACNKVDLVDSTRLKEEDFKDSVFVSATKGIGLDVLLQEIERKIMESTGVLHRVFRVSSGGEEYRWLYKLAAVKTVAVDEDDPNFLLVEVIISPSANAKFTHMFSHLTVPEAHLGG